VTSPIGRGKLIKQEEKKEAARRAARKAARKKKVVKKKKVRKRAPQVVKKKAVRRRAPRTRERPPARLPRRRTKEVVAEPGEVLEAGKLEGYLKRRYPERNVGAEVTEALRDYRGRGYQDLQEALRKGLRLGTTETESGGFPLALIRKHLDALLAESPALGRSTVLWRGGHLPGNVRVGATITDKGYLSTSARRAAAEDFVTPFSKQDVIRITTRKEQKGLWVQGIRNTMPPGQTNARIALEAEVLLPRGTRFKVTRIRRLTKVQYETEFGKSPKLRQYWRNEKRIRIVDVEALL